MSKERLTIPTPAGPRKVYCYECDIKGIDFAKHTWINCIGCPLAFAEGGCLRHERTCGRERFYEQDSAKCDECGSTLLVFISPEDEQ